MQLCNLKTEVFWSCDEMVSKQKWEKMYDCSAPLVLFILIRISRMNFWFNRGSVVSKVLNVGQLNIKKHDITCNSLGNLRYILKIHLLFSRQVLSNCLWPHGLQHARPPCPSPSPGVYPSSCPLNQWCHPTSEMPSHPHCPLLLLPSIFPSIRVFSTESPICIRWPKHWSFSCSISPSKEYSGLTSFKIDWDNLLTFQETLKSLFQHSLKASILRHSAFFTLQLSHLYMTTGKTIALTIWAFIGKVISLLFKTQSREESRWQRNRTGRSLSLLQIHRKNNRTVKKVYKTTSDR